MWTVCLKSQVSGNKICFTQSEVDYFVNQDLTAKSLIVDTTLKGIKIRRCDSINNEVEKNNIDLIANELDLKLTNKKQDLVLDNYKVNYNKCQDKYEKKEKWNKIYKKVVFVLASVIVAESGLIYLITK